MALTISLMASGATNAEEDRIRALFETRAEAEKAAAKNFNCSGAHQMGDKWMPCESHMRIQKREQHDQHDGHHHH